MAQQPASDKPSLDDGALALLPAEDESPRCADFAESIQLDPGGTAINAAMVVLVETPLPWPTPVFEHQFLAGLTSMMPTTAGPARVLAAVPTEGEALRVFTWWRDDDGETQGRVHHPDDVGVFMNRLTDISPDTLSDDVAPEQAILICTQGSHDVCCGTEGTKLAKQSDLLLPHVATFRVSHTGGHRFSPTAMTLPDGRMWASLDIKALDGIVNRTYPAGEIAILCRGWWGAARGPEQIAERAALAVEGWDLDDAERTIDVVEAGDDWWTIHVTTPNSTYRADIELGRMVPTIACRAAGGLPAKPAHEYALIAFNHV